jgi:Flp pilus assembly CpaE family ATPase
MKAKETTADYDRYTCAKDLSMLDYPWRQNMRKDIESGAFVKFVSANASAKQFVVVNLEKFGVNFKVTNLGCGVQKIESIKDDA